MAYEKEKKKKKEKKHVHTNGRAYLDCSKTIISSVVYFQQK